MCIFLMQVSDDGRLVSILRCGAVTSNMIRAALQKEQVTHCVVETDNERHLHKKGIGVYILCVH